MSHRLFLTDHALTITVHARWLLGDLRGSMAAGSSDLAREAVVVHQAEALVGQAMCLLAARRDELRRIESSAAEPV
jgi:hypothetical protein